MFRDKYWMYHPPPSRRQLSGLSIVIDQLDQIGSIALLEIFWECWRNGRWNNFRRFTTIYCLNITKTFIAYIDWDDYDKKWFPSPFKILIIHNMQNIIVACLLVSVWREHDALSTKWPSEKLIPLARYLGPNHWSWIMPWTMRDVTKAGWDVWNCCVLCVDLNIYICCVLWLAVKTQQLDTTQCRDSQSDWLQCTNTEVYRGKSSFYPKSHILRLLISNCSGFWAFA